MSLSLLSWRIFMPVALVSLIGCGSDDNNDTFAIDVNVLSSAKDQVSGGEARIQVVMPEQITGEHLTVRLNGTDVKNALEEDLDTHTLTGVIEGLNVGENTLQVGSASEDHDVTPLDVVLTNHPLSGPIFSGPQQQPFYCNPDDMAAIGLADPDDNCMVDIVVSFKYFTTQETWSDYTLGMERPDDMSTTVTSDGKELDFIVRWERGTINRFLFSIAMLSSDSQDSDMPDLESWNKKLLFYFRGGTAIGHKQGDFSSRRALYVEGLKRGYAVAFSSGTATKTHYNIQLAGETALMLKERFITEYAVPEYTVAVGQSGGAVQQYLFSQNHKGLLDAIIPAFSYPDMLTQTIPAGDCSLIERWIDFTIMDDSNSHWTDWTQRTLLEGMNASNEVFNEVRSELSAYGLAPPGVPNGSSECTEHWNSLATLVYNPLYGTVDGISAEDQANTEWTHYADAINVYGVADDGYANRTWDNVGVQYGLKALTDGTITADEFLDLNFNAGTWKQEAAMIQEGCPFIESLCLTVDPEQSIFPEQIDLWSARNFELSDGTNPAPRATADTGAIESAINAGFVNTGDIQIPTIDLRVNLEHELDMHNTIQSFVTRQRLINFDGDASNQVIWFFDPSENEDHYDAVPEALDVMDKWMSNIAANPENSISANKPVLATDSCFDAEGVLVAAGDDVWNGILDESQEKGVCTERNKTYTNSRMVAGAPLSNDVFKCDLQPIATAIDDGLYAEWVPSTEQIEKLNAIFPEGVCKF